MLASSRFTRGLCLCLRRTCKPAFTFYITWSRIPRFSCARQLRIFRPSRYSVVGFLDKNKDTLFQDFKRLLYNRYGRKVHSPNLVKRKCIGYVVRIGSIIMFHLKSQVLQTVWCYITGEAAGEIWNWLLLEMKGLSAQIDTVHCTRPEKKTHSLFQDFKRLLYNRYGRRNCTLSAQIDTVHCTRPEKKTHSFSRIFVPLTRLFKARLANPRWAKFVFCISEPIYTKRNQDFRAALDTAMRVLW